ncbi:probable membrane-associated kinase regulator 6 isoform X2 [Momordica charantia]|uniref:Probable membrane-associated kinase regulator 6 isoform X2 n=1 Tax=Momordica charantia TaxID=3673 RepID=A0A6J1DSC2_MOMCH|nr:probable membrane-associated kinase regulator 6 isoform X2 [Momordica charantia]
MEASSSQGLSIESFSYSWLVNIKSSFRKTSLDEASFIEMDPTMPPSKRFFTSDFNFPALAPSPSSLPLVHADHLISDGYIVTACEATTAAISNSLPVVILAGDAPGTPESSCSVRKAWRRLSRQIFQKYLNFLRPLCRKIQGEKLFNGGSRHPITREASWSNQCCDEWRRSCDSESSIYEAVLHCKRSIGK